MTPFVLSVTIEIPVVAETEAIAREIAHQHLCEEVSLVGSDEFEVRLMTKNEIVSGCSDPTDEVYCQGPSNKKLHEVWQLCPEDGRFKKLKEMTNVEASAGGRDDTTGACPAGREGGTVLPRREEQQGRGPAPSQGDADDQG